MKRTTKRHYLKCWPKFFDAIQRGEKTFELRIDDGRGFRKGHTLVLERYDPKRREYTGKTMTRKVTYLMRGPAFGLASGHVCMSFLNPSKS